MLHFCPANNCIRTLKVLLENDASVDKFDDYGTPSLHVALGKRHTKVAKVHLQSDLIV